MNIGDLKNKLRILYYFFSPSALILILLIFLTLIYGLVEMAAVGAIVPVLEAGLEGATAQSIGAMGWFGLKAWYLKLGMAFGFNYLVISSIILISVTVFSFIYKALYTYFSQKVLAYLWVYHQRRIYSVLCRAQYMFYVNEKQGKLIYNSAVASDSISAALDSFVRGVSEAIKAFFLGLLLLFSSWAFTLILALIGVIYILFSKKIIQELVNKSSLAILNLKQRQHQNLNEFINGIKLIKVFNRVSYWLEQYMGLAEKNANLLIKVQMGSFLPSFFIQMAIGVGIGVTGIFIGMQAGSTIISRIPMLGLFAIAFSRINDALSFAISYLAAVERHLPNLTACYDILNKTPLVPPSNHLAHKITFNQEIRFDNVSFAYNRDGNNVISNISLVIPKNNTVALVGASGGGKTTILNLLLRLFEDYSGQIRVDGTDIRLIDYASYYQVLGFVSQEPFLFNGTIFENVAFGSQASLDEVKAACEKADASDFIENLELGYSSLVGDNGLKLSGGQKQRIGIARALLKQPQLLILDEPTSALDNESEQRIQLTLDKLSHSLTVLIVAHRMSTIQNADKIIVLKGGRIMEEGRHQDLIKQGGYYHQLYC